MNISSLTEKPPTPVSQIETKKLINKLLQSFDGAVITNSKGKQITLTCKPKGIGQPFLNEDTTIELWTIEFEDYFGQKEDVTNSNRNYINIGGDPVSKRIVTSYALLNHPDLRGKEAQVYFKIKSMLADKLKQKTYSGFKIYTEVARKATHEEFQRIFKTYRHSKEEMEKAILNSYYLKRRIDMGYTKFNVNFKGNNSDIVEVTYEINPNLQEPVVEITIDGKPLFA